jgi:protein TonB
MQRPKVVCSPSIRVPKKALEQQVSGMALAQCVVDVDGSLCDCKLLRSLPYMDEAILDAVDGMQYQPIIYKGRPVRVQMVIPIRIPKRESAPPP